MNLRNSLAAATRSTRAAFIRAWRPRWPRKVSAPAAAPSETLRLPPALADRIENLRGRHRRAALVRSGSLALGLAGICLISQGLADWWFGLPWLARAALLVLDLTALVWIYRVLFHPPLRVRLNHVDMARLVERQWPELDQRLLTAVELAEGDGLSTSGSHQLSARILAIADHHVAHLDLRRIVPLRRVVLPAMAAAFAALATLAVGIIGGDATGPLLRRIALLNPPRPTRTVVVPVTRHLFVAKGDSVTLLASSRRMRPGHGRVELALATESASGYALDTEEIKPGVFAVTVPAAQASFRYRFILNDGRGEEFTVTVKDPPTFAALELEARYPPYTKLPPARLDPEKPGVLAGSNLSIRATASTRLRSATVVRHGLATPLEAALDATGTKIGASLPIPTRDLQGWSLHLVDEDGVTSRNETVYPIEIIPDKPPKIEWVWPRAKRLTITRRAQVAWAIKASDDFGLESLALHYQALPNDESEANSPLLKERQESIPIDPAAADGVFRNRLDFSRQPLVWQVGRRVEYWAEAIDGNNVTGPGVSKTAHQQLIIVNPEEKTAELFARSRGIAAAINTLAERHARVTAETEEALRRDGPPPSLPNP